MSQLPTRVSLLLAGLAALTLATSPALADSVTPSGTLNSIPLSADGTVRAFCGSVQPFGNVQGGLALFPNADGTFTGDFIMLARGEIVYGTIAGFFTSQTTYFETITFTGGTGRCRRISGQVQLSGTFHPDGTATDTVVGGTVSIP
jgi:hypothetical protein